MKERFYSVLVVNSSPALSPEIPRLFPETGFYPVKSVTSGVLARRTGLFRTFDIVLINAPLVDENGISLALDMAKNTLSSVLYLSPPSLYGAVSEGLKGSGVYVLKKPFSLSLLETSVSFMCATSDRIARVEERRMKTEEKMEEIKLVSRAKLVVMEDMHMGEEEAQKYILSRAMDRCISKKEAAADIINAHRPL